MKAIIQRVNKSSVTVNSKVIGKIDKGLCVLIGYATDDNEQKIDKLIDKIINLRIFDDENGEMNKSILEVKGSILVISNFTLYADCSKGSRPSFIKALKYSESEKLYKKTIEKFKNLINTQCGEFGADMKVNIENDGPVTIEIEI